jgi:flagellar motor switch protein FliN/FliY
MSENPISNVSPSSNPEEPNKNRVPVNEPVQSQPSSTENGDLIKVKKDTQVVTPKPITQTPNIKPQTTISIPETEKMGMLMEVGLLLAVELGRTRLTVREVLELQKGSVIELDRMAGDTVDVLVNDHLLARGEVVVVDDKFGVRISEIITPSKVDSEG